MASSGSRRRRAGALAMAVGGLVTLTTTAFMAYASYVDWQLSHVVNLPADPARLEATWVRPPAPAFGGLAEGDAPAPAAGGPATPLRGAPPAPPPRPLLPPTRLRIPSIQLDANVLQVGTKVEKGQTVWEVPAHAVGHYRMTALPGQGGNIVMSGHISSPFRGEGSIFGRLPDVRVGTTVTVETEEGDVFAYEVISRDILKPTAVDVFDPTPTETLTLITCYPDLIYSHRLVVRAVPIPMDQD